MGVLVGGLTVGRPARVADADGASQRVFHEQSFEVRELADTAAYLDALTIQSGDARGIVAAILESLQRADEDAARLAGADVSDDSAHALFLAGFCLFALLLGPA